MDKETILDCTIWLHHISGALGNREQEKQLIEHTIFQSNKSNRIYIFIISLLNYSVIHTNCSQLSKALRIPPKIFTVLTEFRIFSFGGKPLWNDILTIAQKKLIKEQHRVAF